MCYIYFIKSEKFGVPNGFQVRPEIGIILKSKIDFKGKQYIFAVW